MSENGQDIYGVGSEPVSRRYGFYEPVSYGHETEHVIYAIPKFKPGPPLKWYQKIDWELSAIITVMVAGILFPFVCWYMWGFEFFTEVVAYMCIGIFVSMAMDKR